MTDKDETIRKLKEQNRLLQRRVDALLDDFKKVSKDKDQIQDTLRQERAIEQMRVRQKAWDRIQMARFEEV